MATRSTGDRIPSEPANIVAATIGSPRSASSCSNGQADFDVEVHLITGVRRFQSPGSRPIESAPYPESDSTDPAGKDQVPSVRAQLPRRIDRVAPKPRDVELEAEPCQGVLKGQLARLEASTRELERIKRSNSWRVRALEQAKLGARR